MIRVATEKDAGNILAIYSPLVRDSTITFELVSPTLDEMRQRIASTLPTFPWLVFESDNQIVGYAYAALHRQRQAYQWSVDVAIYVDANAKRRGYARALYRTLFEILRAQGFFTVYAGITLPNAASIGLHESMGFTRVGVYKNAGYKLGQWSDVGWWGMRLRDYVESPAPPRPFGELPGSVELERILKDGNSNG